MALLVATAVSGRAVTFQDCLAWAASGHCSDNRYKHYMEHCSRQCAMVRAPTNESLAMFEIMISPSMAWLRQWMSAGALLAHVPQDHHDPLVFGVTCFLFPQWLSGTMWMSFRPSFLWSICLCKEALSIVNMVLGPWQYFWRQLWSAVVLAIVLVMNLCLAQKVPLLLVFIASMIIFAWEIDAMFRFVYGGRATNSSPPWMSFAALTVGLCLVF